MTRRIVERSLPTRAACLALIERERGAGTNRATLARGNLAHGFAASGEDKAAIKRNRAPGIDRVDAVEGVPTTRADLSTRIAASARRQGHRARAVCLHAAPCRRSRRGRIGDAGGGGPMTAITL